MAGADAASEDGAGAVTEAGVGAAIGVGLVDGTGGASVFPQAVKNSTDNAAVRKKLFVVLAFSSFIIALLKLQIMVITHLKNG